MAEVDRETLLEAGSHALAENVGTATRHMYAQRVVDAVLPLIADAIEAESRSLSDMARSAAETGAPTAASETSAAAWGLHSAARLVRSLGGNDSGAES